MNKQPSERCLELQRNLDGSLEIKVPAILAFLNETMGSAESGRVWATDSRVTRLTPLSAPSPRPDGDAVDALALARDAWSKARDREADDIRSIIVAIEAERSLAERKLKFSCDNYTACAAREDKARADLAAEKLAHGGTRAEASALAKAVGSRDAIIVDLRAQLAEAVEELEALREDAYFDGKSARAWFEESVSGDTIIGDLREKLKRAEGQLRDVAEAHCEAEARAADRDSEERWANHYQRQEEMLRGRITQASGILRGWLCKHDGSISSATQVMCLAITTLEIDSTGSLKGAGK